MEHHNIKVIKHANGEELQVSVMIAKPSIDPVLKKYVKLLEMGVPRHAVVQKMILFDIDPNRITEVEAYVKACRGPEPQIAPELKKFVKLVQMGAPRESVTQKMIFAKVDPHRIQEVLDYVGAIKKWKAVGSGSLDHGRYVRQPYRATGDQIAPKASNKLPPNMLKVQVAIKSAITSVIVQYASNMPIVKDDMRLVASDVVICIVSFLDESCYEPKKLDLISLRDNLDTAERSKIIMRAEPALKKLIAYNEDYTFTNFGNAAHGTNLAAVVSALRNTNGQLIPIEFLGELWATGATEEHYIREFKELQMLVFAADLLNFGAAGAETAERYSLLASGTRASGMRSIIRSEAFLIPAIVIGDLVDPNGKGAKLNEYFQNPCQDSARSMGMTVAEAKEFFATQIIGERLKIRSIFVSHPTNPEKDLQILNLVKDLAQQISVEQECDFSHIHIGLIRDEMATFKKNHPGKQVVSLDDLRMLLPS